MDQSWKLSGKKYGPFMEIVWELYGQVKSMFTNFLTLLYSENMELISFWTISRYFPHMEKLWKKKLKTVSVALFPDIGHIWRKCGKQSVLDNFSDIVHIWRKYVKGNCKQAVLDHSTIRGKNMTTA